jgi:chromosome segregation ATPase
MLQISSLYTQVINLQTSLAAAEQALHDANMTTAQSQERCLAMLQDLRGAQSKIASLEVRAKDDADEKCDLQQEIANLKGEVLRLQNGIEQVTRITGAVGLFIVHYLDVMLNRLHSFSLPVRWCDIGL